MSKKTQNDSEDFFMNTDGDQISMIAEITTEPEGDEVLKMEFDKEFPVMPLRNMVMFPHVVMPVTIGRTSTLKLINTAFKKKLPIVLACQVSAEVDDPGYADLYHVGVIAKVLRIFEMPGGTTTAIMQSSGPRVHLDSIVRTLPYMKGKVTPLEEVEMDEQSDESEETIKTSIMDTKKWSKHSLGVAFVLGMMILGGSLILMISNMKSYDRCVTVKGLCEKEVMADKVIWPIIYKQGGNELGTLYNTVQEMNRTIIEFLKEAGVTDDEITVNAPSILDTRTNLYGERNTYHYIITAGITVCSNQVDRIVKLQTEQAKLYEKGIPVGMGENWSHPTTYSFTGLNDIKPAMIEEATINARQAAEKFAKDSHSKLGKIKTATQGQFSVSDRDSNTPYIKNVRVVTNVVYYLKD